MRSFLIATTIIAGLAATPVAAQSNLDGRVGKLEGEMRAVQRKVFPGGGAYLEPQITSSQTPAAPIGTPATSAVSDLTARVSALESQIASLTGQIEQTQYKQRQLEDAFNAYRKATDSKLATGVAPSAEPAPIGNGGDSGGEDEGAPPPVRATSSRGDTPAGPVSAPRDAARATQVTAVGKPSTGDAPEDAYLYGYRLWQAKLYPEAEAQLKSVVADFPKHRRASYAQNLLGRAYLDEGKPSLASIAFYDNYKKMPDGERAPDSLLYLAQALVMLKKPADACKVYGELSDVYAAKITAPMQADITRGRAAARCK